MSTLQTPVDALTGEIAASLVSLVPSILAAIVVLVVGFALGRMLDGRIYDWSWDRNVDEKARDTPFRFLVTGDEDAVSHLLGTTIRYAVYAVAVAVAVGFLNVRELNALVATIVSFVPKFVGAIVVSVVGFGAGRILNRVVETVVRESDVSVAVSRTLLGGATDATPEKLSKLAGYIAAYYVYLFTLFVAAGILSVPYLTNVLRRLLVYYPLVVIAGIVVLIGALVAEFVGRVVRESDVVEDLPAHDVVGHGVEAIVYLFTVVIALSVAGVDEALLIALLAVSILPLGLALALAIGIAFGYGGKEEAEKYLENRSS